MAAIVNRRRRARGMAVTARGWNFARAIFFLLFINSDTPYLSYVIGVIFFLFGFLMWGSASIGYIFMLNYVPSNNKESFMSLAYSLDGLIAGITTVLAGYLVLWLDTNNIVICSYHFARNKAEWVQLNSWDLVVIDEAHFLRNSYKPGNKIGNTLRNALEGRRKILLTASKYVKNNGAFAYMTCSVLNKENRDQINWFLSLNNDFCLEKDTLIYPAQGGDGFYASLMRKVSN